MVHTLRQEDRNNSVVFTTENTKCTSKVVRTERGWSGHFICADSCQFRRNTLLECKDIKIVVSTVGALFINGKYETIGHRRHFETKAFKAEFIDGYWDANVLENIEFDSTWALEGVNINSDKYANKMHEDVVAELEGKLTKGLALSE